MSLTTTDKEQLSECLKAAEVAEKAINIALAIKNDNDEILAKFNVAHVLWEKERNKYLSDYDNWVKRTGEFAKYYDHENPKTQWFGCYDRPSPGICTATVPINDAECKKLGSDFVDTGARTGCHTTWIGCVRKQSIQCTRPANVRNSIHIDYLNHKPTLRDEPIYGTGAFPIKEIPPINVAISCCSNTTTLSGNIEAKDNIQSCTMQIQQELSKQETANKQIEMEKKAVATEQNTITKDNTTNGGMDSGILFIMGGGGLSLVCMCCSCILIVIVMMI